MIETVVVHGLVSVTTVLGDLANVALKTILDNLWRSSPCMNISITQHLLEIL